MPSIVDVANAANVAPSTVSLVMNHRDRVAPDTRKRVEEAMQRLGYRARKRKAQKTEKSRSLRLAFIYSPTTMYDGAISVYIRELVRGVQTAIDQSSSTLSLIRAAKHVKQDLMFNQQVEEHEFDAAILLGPEPEDGYLERLEDLSLPLVVFNNWSPYSRFSSVSVDYYEGGRLGAQRLIDLGHRKIATIGGNPDASWPKDHLEVGARHALDAAGIEPVLRELAMKRDEARLAELAQRIKNSGATALFMGDRFAEDMARALVAAGLSIPDDISLMGFDGLGLTISNDVRLTSVGYNRPQMGVLAVELLQRAIADPDNVQALLATVKVRIVEGDSLAAV